MANAAAILLPEMAIWFGIIRLFLNDGILQHYRRQSRSSKLILDLKTTQYEVLKAEKNCSLFTKDVILKRKKIQTSS